MASPILLAMTNPATTLSPLLLTLSTLAYQGRALLAQTLHTFHSTPDGQNGRWVTTHVATVGHLTFTFKVWDRVVHGVSTQTTTDQILVRNTSTDEVFTVKALEALEALPALGLAA